MKRKNESSKSDSAKNLKLAGSGRKVKLFAQEPDITSMMMDPRYLRQSSALIHDALQKGFDVLQLANGDIVTTGTKTVVYQYSWDLSKGKLVKAKPAVAKKTRESASEFSAEEEMETEEA